MADPELYSMTLHISNTHRADVFHVIERIHVTFKSNWGYASSPKFQSGERDHAGRLCPHLGAISLAHANCYKDRYRHALMKRPIG